MTENNNPLISMIVPVYNVEKYLGKCIESILAQTYRNFELILVDDGSPDRCGSICDEYSAIDSRIRVLHQRNGGVSAARNAGLQIMGGQYVTFVDSDDYIPRNYLEYLYELISKEKNVQISIVSIQELNENENPIHVEQSVVEILTTEEVIKRMLLRENITHACGGKLYQTDLWKNVCFPERIPIGEDMVAAYTVISKADKVCISDIKLYYYVQREHSAIHQKCTKDTLKVLECSDGISAFLLDHWPTLHREILDLQMATYLKNLQGILNTGFHEFPEEQKKIKTFVRKNWMTVVMAKRIPVKDKIKTVLALMPKGLFLKVYNRFDGNIV